MLKWHFPRSLGAASACNLAGDRRAAVGGEKNSGGDVGHSQALKGHSATSAVFLCWGKPMVPWAFWETTQEQLSSVQAFLSDTLESTDLNKARWRRLPPPAPCFLQLGASKEAAGVHPPTHRRHRVASQGGCSRSSSSRAINLISDPDPVFFSHQFWFMPSLLGTALHFSQSCGPAKLVSRLAFLWSKRHTQTIR